MLDMLVLLFLLLLLLLLLVVVVVVTPPGLTANDIPAFLGKKNHQEAIKLDDKIEGFILQGQGARDPSYKGSEITPTNPMKNHGCKWVFH